MATQAPKFETVKKLTKPTISLKAQGTIAFIEVQGKMYVGRSMTDKAKEGEAPKEPATLLDVINLETGEESQVVVPAIFKSVLNDDYKGDYVGKQFRLENKGKRETRGGNRMNVLDIQEIKWPKAAAK